MKVLMLLFVVTISTLLASIYGVIHDQITYSISPEYFTKFKFIQFKLEGSPLPERMLATLVGIGATWWMGLFAGIICGGISFIQNNHRNMLRTSLESLGIVLVVAVLMGVIGWIYGLNYVTHIGKAETGRVSAFHPGVEDYKSFIRVGIIHNFSYIGGVLGIGLGVVWQFVRRRQLQLKVSNNRQV
jgi:hypothetical protein